MSIARAALDGAMRDAHRVAGVPEWLAAYASFPPWRPDFAVPA
jgi:hypothetical protein